MIKRLALTISILLVGLMGALPAQAQDEPAVDAGVAALLPMDTDLYIWLDVAGLQHNIYQLVDIGQRAGLLVDVNADLVYHDLISAPLMAGSDMTYERDIAPWLGDEAAVGFRYLTQQIIPSRSGREIEFIVVTENTDRSAVLEFIQKLVNAGKQSGAPLAEGVYRGVPLYRRGDIGLAMAGDYLALGSLDMVRAAIETYKGAPSLAGTPGFVQVRANLPTESAAGVYLNTQSMARIIDYFARSFEQAFGYDGSSEMTPVADQFAEMVTGLAFSVRVVHRAVRVDMTFAVDDEAVRHYKGPDGFLFRPDAMSGRVFQALPDGTLAMLAGRDLPDIFGTTRDAMAALEPLAGAFNHLLVRGGYQGPALTGVLRVVQHWPAWFEGLTGMDFERDVMAWMGGEYAVSLVPLAPGLLSGRTSRVPVDVLAVAEISDQDAAQRAYGAFPKALVALGLKEEADIHEGMVNEVPVRIVHLLQHHRARVAWAMPPGFAGVSTGLYGVVQLIDTVRFGRLPAMLDNPRLLEVLRRLDGPGHTMLFVDVHRSWAYLNTSLPQYARPSNRWSVDTQKLFAALDSFTISGRAVEDDVYQLTGLIIFGE